MYEYFDKNILSIKLSLVQEIRNEKLKYFVYPPFVEFEIEFIWHIGFTLPFPESKESHVCFFKIIVLVLKIGIYFKKSCVGPQKRQK